MSSQHKDPLVLTYDKLEINTALLVKLFNTALAEREYYFNIDGTNAFRLFNAEGDGVGGLTMSSSDGHLLIQWYSKGIYHCDVHS